MKNNYLIYEPAFAKDFGINATIMLSLFLYKYKYWYERDELADDGSFFISTKDIEEQTGLKRRRRESGTKTLIDGGFIEVLSEDGETFRLKVNVNHVQNVHALIETMYKTYMLPCTKCTHTINRTSNQITSNQNPTSALGEPEKNIMGVLPAPNTCSNVAYKSIKIPYAWAKAMEDKGWVIKDKLELLEDYFRRNPKQRDWALQSLKNFLGTVETAERVMFNKPKKTTW